jgi:hypothetical protein
MSIDTKEIKMNGYKTVFTLILTVVLLVSSIGCNGQVEEPVVAPPDPTAVPAPDTTEDPETVVQTFFDWYLAYAETGNPLVDGAYRDSPYLTANLVSQVDEIIASFEGGGYDPFLCAQDIPGAIETASFLGSLAGRGRWRSCRQCQPNLESGQ